VNEVEGRIRPTKLFDEVSDLKGNVGQRVSSGDGDCKIFSLIAVIRQCENAPMSTPVNRTRGKLSAISMTLGKCLNEVTVSRAD
jgi:hypothetical protein